MKTKTQILASLFFLCFAYQVSYSQSGNKTKFIFPEEIKKIEIPKEFSKYNAVIVEEQISFARSNSGIKRHLRIKIQNNKGLEQYRKICLPESQDPLESVFLVPRYKAESIHYPLGAPNMITYFAARIIKPDGSVKVITPRDSFIKYTWEELGEKSTYYNYFYIFDDLKVGDEIDIYYAHREIYYHSTSFNIAFNTWVPYRVFFNSNIPKVQYDLNIRTSIQYAVKFTFENNSEPQDSTFEKNGTNDDVIMHWHFNNLPAISNIWNSHLYEDLPNIKFYGAGDLIVKDSKNESVGVIEYPWNYSLRPYVGIKKKYNGYDKRFSSIIAYNKLFQEVLANSSDTITINQINNFHEKINHQFKFSYDNEIISGDDILNPRLGKFIENKQLRRIGRFNLYREILNRFDIPYYSVVIADKRIDNLNFNKFNYGFSIPGIFCLMDKGGFYFIQPKNHQFGHHINELPFYYEGCPIILIPQREPEALILNLGNAYLPELVYSSTPSSSETENTRKTSSMINLNLKGNLVEFNTKLSLSGQFSTLLRGNYTDEYIDSSVNNLYYKKIYHLSPNTRLTNLEKTFEDSIYPFNTNFKILYSDASLLTKKNDSIFTLNLSNIIVHVIEQNIDSNIINSFYPDFKQSDIYRYYIKTDIPVKLSNENLHINIENSLGKYTYNVFQKSETEIMIESYLLISSDKVTSQKINDVIEISKQVNNVRSPEITLIAQKP